VSKTRKLSTRPRPIRMQGLGAVVPYADSNPPTRAALTNTACDFEVALESLREIARRYFIPSVICVDSVLNGPSIAVELSGIGPMLVFASLAKLSCSDLSQCIDRR